jgi:hypothetical protein
MGKEAEVNYGYPVQMADMRKGKWRFQELLAKGYTQEQLREEELKLWESVNKRVDAASKPPLVCPLIPDSQLLGFGWEWATYATSGSDEVIKLPAGIFPEVSTLVYLQNTHHAYEVCKKYFGSFVRETTFARELLNGISTNVVRQKKI